jgi:hypothetical protein
MREANTSNDGTSESELSIGSSPRRNRSVEHRRLENLAPDGFSPLNLEAVAVSKGMKRQIRVDFLPQPSRDEPAYPRGSPGETQRWMA